MYLILICRFEKNIGNGIRGYQSVLSVGRTRVRAGQAVRKGGRAFTAPLTGLAPLAIHILPGWETRQTQVSPTETVVWVPTDHIDRTTRTTRLLIKVLRLSSPSLWIHFTISST